MAATEYTLTDTAWTNLGTTPCYVELDAPGDVILHVAATAPSDSSKVGTRISYTPPREPFKDIGFDGNNLYARADSPLGGKVTVQRGG